MLRTARTSWLFACALVGCRSTAVVADPEPVPTPAPSATVRVVEPPTPDDRDATPPADAPAGDEASPSGGDVTVIRAEEDPRPPSGRVPRMRVAPPTVGPSYSADALRRVMRSKVPAVRACYEALLTAHPDARGRGQLSFTIGPDGTVVDASMALGAFDDETFVDCVLSVLRDARFPAPTGGGSLVVTYPLVFLPSGDPTAEDLAPPRG